MNVPPPPDETARLRALAACGILDTSPDPSFDQVTRLAAGVFRAPIALISFVDARREWFKSRHNWKVPEVPRDEFFCAQAIQGDRVFVVPDTLADPRFATSVLVRTEPCVRFYAAAPLVAPGGERLGALCVMDVVPRSPLTGDEEDTLENLARLVMEALRAHLERENLSAETSRRERAEAGCRDSEARCQRLIASSPGMVFRFLLRQDGSFGFPFVGEGCQEIYHLDPEAVAAEPNLIMDAIWPEDRVNLDYTLAESAASLSSWEWEGRITADGETRWLRGVSHPARLEDGSTLWDGLFMDITEQKETEEAIKSAEAELEQRVAERTAALVQQAAALRAEIVLLRRTEAALRESDYLARAVIEGTPYPVFAKDAEGRYLLVNHTAAEGFNRPAAAILGHTDAELLPPEAATTLMRSDRDVLSGRRTVFAEARIPAPGGERLFLNTKAPLLDSNGKIAGIIGISRDITQEKRAEEQLHARARQQAVIAQLGQSALSDVGVPSLLADAVQRVGETLQVDVGTILEHVPERGGFFLRASFGLPATVLGTFDAQEGTGSAAGYTLMTRTPTIVEDAREETRFKITLALSEQNLVSSVTVIIAGEGQPYGTLAAHTRQPRSFIPDEVSFMQTVANILAAAIERRQSEHAVQMAHREAERANAAKSEFLSRMSHELRTPLNAILGFGQLLELEVENLRQRENVEHVLTAGRHLLALIDEVLDIARIESGRMDLTLEPIAIHDLVQEAVSLVRPLCSPQSISIGVSPPPPHLADARILGDGRRLRQVLLNLLSNAVKYNRPGGRVWLSLIEAPNPRRLRVTVSDTGLGIEAEKIDRLFTPFERLGAERSSVEGTGIGLALSKRLMEAQSGTIGVESKPSVGSTFWIELDRAGEVWGHEDPALAATIQQVFGPLPGVMEEPATPKRSVLYVENGLPSKRLIACILDLYSPAVLLTATTGKTALDLAHLHRPAIIFLDMNLPDLSGEHMLHALYGSQKADGKPVIVAFSDAAHPAGRLLEAGARRCIQKPLTAEQLWPVMEEFLT